MTVDIDRIEQLARAATPGPWDNHSVNGDPIESVWLTDGNVVATWAIREPRFEFHAPQAREDAAFIAAANPAAVLELVQRLRAAEGMNERADEVVAKLHRDIDRLLLESRTALAKYQAIVRDLAASEPFEREEYSGKWSCTACPANGTDLRVVSHGGFDESHWAECPWRRAVETSK